MQLIVDGSQTYGGSMNYHVGWAFIAHHGGKSHEKYGHHLLKSNGGYHEHIAMVQACLYAAEQGADPEQTSIITDDQEFGYAPMYLHEGNFMKQHIHVKSRVRTAIQLAKLAVDDEVVLKYLKHARIIKVKGHQGDVEQERVDYLARHASKVGFKNIPDGPLPYCEWQTRGRQRYTDPDTKVLDYPAFCHPNVASQLKSARQ